MTNFQLVILLIFLGILWITFQIVLEIVKGKILVKRQQELVEATTAKVYEMAAKYIVKTVKDVREVKELIK